jgi:hypothetical protein
MFRTNVTVRTATLRMKLRELNPVADVLGDFFGSYVVGLEAAIIASDYLKGHFDHCEVSCTEVQPGHLIVRYRAGSVHQDVFVSEIKKFIPLVRDYIEQWVGRPLQWLEYSFDISNGEADTGYQPLQFDVGFLGMQYEESYMNGNYLNTHEPCNPQPGIEVNYPSHLDTVPILNPNPGDPNVV